MIEPPTIAALNPPVLAAHLFDLAGKEACWVLYETVCSALGKRVVDDFLGMMGRKRSGEWAVNATRYWKVSKVNTPVFGRLLKGSQQTVSRLKLKRLSPQT